MSRNLRTFSTLGRSVFKSPASLRRRNGDFHIQHVRIKKRAFSYSRILMGSASFGLAWYVWHVLGKIEDEDEDEDEEKPETRTEHIKEAVQQVKVHSEAEKLGPEGDAEKVEEPGTKVVEEVDDSDLVPEEQPEDAWFIPLGLAHEVPRTYYKGTDPEWQSFVHFARDRKRGQIVKNELAGIVGQYISSVKTFQKFLGTPVTTGKFWLDYDFPDGPPPEYERAGIEITEDYIAYTVRPVEAINVSRLQATLWPTATGTSLWASCSTLWKLQTAKIRKALNIEEPKPTEKSNPSAGYADISQLLGQSESHASSKGAESKESQVKPPHMPATSAPEEFGSGRPWILRPLPGVPKPNTEMSKATTAFKHSLAKNWKRASTPPPRGTFLVSGLVEVYGPKGICTLDVRAAYYPEESHWAVIAIGVRRLQDRKQKPKG